MFCNSPRNTTCMYQSIARDQAPDPAVAQVANGAQPDTDAVQSAYADLYAHLGDDSEGLGLLKVLMGTLTGDLAQDAPENQGFDPNPRGSGRVQGAMDAAIRSGRRQAEAYGFAQRFPDSVRIRNIG
jgi:hypothetical protein